MIGLNLEVEGKAEKHGPGEHCGRLSESSASLFSCHRFQGSSVGKDYCGKNPGRPGDGHHFSVVPHLYNLEIVGAEGYRHCAGRGKQGAYSECQHQQERAEKGNQQITGRPFTNEKCIVYRLCGVAALVPVKHGRGHSSEHGISPECRLVGVFGVPGIGLVSHSYIAADIALINDFPAQDLRHEAVGQNYESEDDSDILQNRFFIHDS